ncbi:MAG: hypothetical protein R3C17_09445 [Planctomycetaceae bacterium]
MRYLSIAVVVSLCISTVGCGTMANLEGKRLAFISAPGQIPVRVYGGVRNDFRWVRDGVGFPDSDLHDNKDGKRHPATIVENPMGVVFGIPMFGYFAIVDPVLSFVGDTLTLPRVLSVIHTNSQCEEVAAHPQTDQHNSSEPGHAAEWR